MRRLLFPVTFLLLAAAVFIVALAFLLRTVSPASWLDFENRVTRSVDEQIVLISATKGDRLELASVETREIFRETDALKLGWVDFGTTEAELGVPVVYRFHVALAEGLTVAVKKHGDLARCVVRAPELRATLPPAIRTEGITKRAVNGWARFNAGERLANLEKQLTAELVVRAPQKAVLAKDKARVALAGFVSRWLIKDGLWGGHDGVKEVVVLFPGEDGAGATPSLSVE
ncbi:MAG: hypothetical protein RJA21_1633 [Gemmatimonadota bacterium]